MASGSKTNTYANKKLAINECLKHFNNFTNALNETANQASQLGQTLQKIEDMTMPEIIGCEQMKKIPSGRFKSGASLNDSLDTFNKIMVSYSDKIKTEAFDNFDNFILQSVLPSDYEVEGVQKHNQILIKELRNSFFSMFNHFLILAADLMEKFLLCTNCSSPVGFPHQLLCLTKSMTTNSSELTDHDGRLITYGMNVCFNDTVIPSQRQNIIATIDNANSSQGKWQIQQKKTKKGKSKPVSFMMERNVHLPQENPQAWSFNSHI